MACCWVSSLEEGQAQIDVALRELVELGAAARPPAGRRHLSEACTESTAKAPSSPAASRAFAAQAIDALAHQEGLRPTASRNGSSASASQPLAEASTATTAAGTRMATKAGATVWGEEVFNQLDVVGGQRHQIAGAPRTR